MRISRQNLAYGVLAVLALALTQHSVKYHLLGTTLGRVAMLLLIVALSLVGKQFGLAAVLLIVFFHGMVNQQEGMTTAEEARVAEIDKALEKLAESISKLKEKKSKSFPDRMRLDSMQDQQKKLQNERQQILTPESAEVKQLRTELSAIDAKLADNKAKESRATDPRIKSALRGQISISTYRKSETQKRLNDQLKKDAEKGAAASVATTATTTSVAAGSSWKPKATGSLGKAVRDAAKATAAEGFDLIGAEATIKQGKPSNEVEVAPFMRESKAVEPFDGSMFRNGHATF